MKLSVQDVELLMKAAKAVGFEIIGFAPSGGAVLDDGSLWNPIDDDGEALRLAVKLWLTTETCMTYAQAITPEGEIYRVFAEEVDDPLAATRRAIVRAAAECAPN